MGWVISEASEWQNYSSHFGEVVKIPRNWTTTHFLAFDSRYWNCHGASKCIMLLAEVLQWAYTEAQAILKDREAWHAGVHGVAKSQTQFSDWITITKLRLKIYLSSILDLLGSGQLMSWPQAMSFIKHCPLLSNLIATNPTHCFFSSCQVYTSGRSS